MVAVLAVRNGVEHDDVEDLIRLVLLEADALPGKGETGELMMTWGGSAEPCCWFGFDGCFWTVAVVGWQQVWSKDLEKILNFSRELKRWLAFGLGASSAGLSFCVDALGKRRGEVGSDSGAPDADGMDSSTALLLGA